MMVKKRAYLLLTLLLLIFIPSILSAQGFTRVIQLQSKRMNGADVTQLQRRLIFLGFKKTGPIDGWYGPLTEGSVKTIQYYMGFPQDGRVTRGVWNTIFNKANEGVLRNISIISNYHQSSFVTTTTRNGPNDNFEEFAISAQNNQVKSVRFRHINDGLIVFRFTLWYLADGIFMIQDVYYGDYSRHIYLKTTGELVELKNGEAKPADPALEGILKRVSQGIQAAGLTVPALIPANLPTGKSPETEAPQSKAAETPILIDKQESETKQESSDTPEPIKESDLKEPDIKEPDLNVMEGK